MRHSRSRPAGPILTLTALAAVSCLSAGSAQQASASSGVSSTVLALHRGAMLAPSKILDFNSVPVGITRRTEELDDTHSGTDMNAAAGCPVRAVAQLCRSKQDASSVSRPSDHSQRLDDHRNGTNRGLEHSPETG
ncbi:hypothetical protein GCM10022295_87220 [Streptomyces osmaniensis]|uniref:Secreted protein n=1 Tax=Streptomyces osmaniensis TaxID=593134 RepID=A0ABP6YZY5_9ACTN